MGWRNLISREVSSTLPAVGLGLSGNKTTSKLKLPSAAALPHTENESQSATLTSVGRTVQATSTLAEKVYAAPRLLAHAGVLLVVGGVVLTGSTGHPASLNPLASQVGFGSVMDQAASADLAAKVAEQANLLVVHEADDTAKALNAQVSLATSDDATLAKRQVVDTAGATTRGITNYSVQSGDTLASIASQFNVTTDTVRWANSMSADTILKPGQNLVILPISGVRYQVQSGDTAQSIADKFQSNADQIVAFNNAEVNGVQSGQSLIIPDGVIAESKPAASTATQAPATSRITTAAAHVQSGGSNGYAYGYCTWYAASRRSVPGWWGNASGWYGNAQISGYSVGTTPRVGAIAWSGAGYYGHVAYVESVSGGMVTVSEMNWNGNWNRVTSRTVSASSFRYIY